MRKQTNPARIISKDYFQSNVRKNWRDPICESKFVKPKSDPQVQKGKNSLYKAKTVPSRQNRSKPVLVGGGRSPVNFLYPNGQVNSEQQIPTKFLQKTPLSRSSNSWSKFEFCHENTHHFCSASKSAKVDPNFNSLSPGSLQGSCRYSSPIISEKAKNDRKSRSQRQKALCWENGGKEWDFWCDSRQ